MPIPVDFSKLAPQDILDIAAFIEHEAEQRYLAFADHLEREGDSESATFFRRMAELERAHGDEVSDRRESRYSGLPEHLRDVVEWDVEGPALERDVEALTVERALNMALASEIRAREFYAEAMQHPVGREVEDVLAELHRDEVQHVRMLEEMKIRTLGVSR